MKPSKYIGGPPGPPKTSDMQDIDDGGPCTDVKGAEAAAPWSSCMIAFDGLNERIPRVAST